MEVHGITLKMQNPLIDCEFQRFPVLNAFFDKSVSSLITSGFWQFLKQLGKAVLAESFFRFAESGQAQSKRERLCQPSTSHCRA